MEANAFDMISCCELYAVCVRYGKTYKIILHNFLNVHSWLRNELLLLWEHVVVLGSELGGNLRLRLDNLLFLLDYLAFDILQAILDQVSF